MEGADRVGEAVGTVRPQAIANNERMVRTIRRDRLGTAGINLKCAYPLWRREIYPGEDIGRHWTVRCLTGETRCLKGSWTG